MSEVRLIDANALKEAVENLVVGGAEGLKDYYENGSKSDENSWIGGVYDAWELIDNAPTVEPEITDKDIQNAIKQGYNDGYAMARAKFERPKGECASTRPKCDCEVCKALRVSYLHRDSITKSDTQI